MGAVSLDPRSYLKSEPINPSRLGRWVKLHRLFPVSSDHYLVLPLLAYICILYPYRPTEPILESIVTGMPVRWTQSSNHRPFLITRFDCFFFFLFVRIQPTKLASLLSGASILPKVLVSVGSKKSHLPNEIVIVIEIEE